MYTGLADEQHFKRRQLDKEGEEHQILKREEYKTTPDTLVNRAYSPAHGEACQSHLTSCKKQIVDGVAEARGLPGHEVSVHMHMHYAHSILHSKFA